MKTNQIMIRQMGGFQVSQRTKDYFFNATELMKQWNKKNDQKKNINHYLDNSATKEFIQALIDDDETIRNHEKPINQIFIKYNAKTNKDGSKEPGAVWMSPYMFLDFAMWLNPAFKVKVLKFISDEMIHFRNEAGDAYRELSSAIAKIVSKSFMPQAMRKVGEALNWIIFDQHERMIRNKQGEESKQRDLWMLEKKVADLINEGFILDYDRLITYLRKVWHNRNTPKVLIP